MQTASGFTFLQPPGSEHQSIIALGSRSSYSAPLQLFLPTHLSSKFWHKVSLVVNVASECGFTEEHYRALQQLQRDLGPHHFNVLAFPCNQFGQQEPDSNKEIESFARRTYSVSFPMFSKVAVTGTGAHPAFKYLTQTSGKEPTWNFWKYLVAPDGKVVGAWDPTVSVEEIRPQITALVRKLILKKREDL
ncbi:Glutathione peroxidase 7 [Myotis brandtii]|uniref:Glutathione peroxidase n=1 Tax=Myotis brandtii TaxID=109478 RepID=S7N6C5_MYOBR|nr:Glutathione peroxidase 7 [Myotis brandtii]